MSKLILGLVIAALLILNGLKWRLILNTLSDIVFPTFLDTSTIIKDNIPAICHGVSECSQETKDAKKLANVQKLYKVVHYKL